MKRKHYNHPSAWEVSELAGKKGITEELDGNHIRALDDALRSIQAKGIATEDITREDFPLDSIQGSVDRWVEEVEEGRGLLLLSGLSIDNFTKDECAIIFYGLGTHFGQAQSQSHMGDRLGHIVNVGGKDTRERAYRNSVELALHTDSSDIVAMMCLSKAMEGGLSGYSSTPAIYNHMLKNHADLLDTLSDGFYYHLFDDATKDAQITNYRVPVFSEVDGYLSCCYLRSYIELAFKEMQEPRSPTQTKALDVFDEVAHSSQFRLDFMLEPGEITIFNNYTVLHTRTEFFDYEDPVKRRHLLRLWLRSWTPRPIANELGVYGSRKGIEENKGGETYYHGEIEYTESPPPKD